MSGRPEDEEAARVAREITARAVRRLDYLEWVMLSVAIVAAIAGGALVAWLIQDLVGLPHRTVWIVTSVVLFTVPGSIALARTRREDREWRQRIKNEREGQGPDV